MSIANPTNLLQESDNVDRNSYTSSSASLTAGRLYLLAVTNSKATTPDTPTVSGASATWDQVTTNSFGGGTRRITVFRCKPTSNGSGALTIGFAGATQTGCQWHLIEVSSGALPGANGANAVLNAVTGNGTATSGSATLAALTDGNSISMGFFSHSAAEGSTVGSGYTSVGTSNNSSPNISLFSEYKNAGATTVDASWTSNVQWGAIALEVRGTPILTQPIENEGPSGLTPLPVKPERIYVLNQLTESDSTTTFIKVKRKTLGQPTGANSTISGGPSGRTFQAVKIKYLGQPTESDIASEFAHGPHIGQAVETDEAIGPFSYTKGIFSEGPEWGHPWSNYMPWSDFPLPETVPHVRPGRVFYQPPLGVVSHVFIGPGGVDAASKEDLLDWSSDEVVGMGHSSASGMIKASRVIAKPEIYREGALWITYDEEGGVAFAGYLNDPTVTDVRKYAELQATGIGADAATFFGRWFFASGFPGDWSPRDGGPWGPGGKGFYVQRPENFQLDTEGHLKWVVTDGAQIHDGDQQGFVLWAQNAFAPIYRFIGHVHLSVTTAHYELRIETATRPDETPTGIVHIPLDGSQDFDIDELLLVPGEIVIISLQRLDDDATGGTSGNFTVTLTDPLAFAMARDNPYSTSELARDIAGLLGWGADHVIESGLNILPFDNKDGNAGEVLDVAAILSDFRHVTRDFPPELYFGPWDEFTYTVYETLEDPVLPPLVRYDQVEISYLASNKKAVLRKRVQATPALLHHRDYGLLSLDDPQFDEETATSFALSAANYLVKSRRGGAATFARVKDGNNNWRTGHAVHAGDTLYLAKVGIRLRVSGVHHSYDDVSVQFDENLAMLDMLLARRQRRWRQLGHVT